MDEKKAGMLIYFNLMDMNSWITGKKYDLEYVNQFIKLYVWIWKQDAYGETEDYWEIPMRLCTEEDFARVDAVEQFKRADINTVCADFTDIYLTGN